jgi:predicted phospho-2-dehydro-3-deoxyheptonate aldolase
MDGHEIRMRRIGHHKSGKFVLVPLDHGVTVGPIKGIMDIRDTINKVAAGGATSVSIHKGLVSEGLRDVGGKIGLIMHISASTHIGPYPNAKILVSGVEEALRLGADAVSVHINVGAETEREMLFDLGEVSRSCREWRVPLLAMMYTRGKNVKDELDPQAIKHIARLGAELGADIIKTNYPGNIETFREVTRGCPVPVLIAGGAKMDTDRQVLQMVKDSIEAGGGGVSIGRNVFQHENPTKMVKAIRRIVIDKYEVEEALAELGGK